ncbi:hypothetical protein Q5752_003806 [Cryptotrichosporon argae]
MSLRQRKPSPPAPSPAPARRPSARRSARPLALLLLAAAAYLIWPSRTTASDPRAERAGHADFDDGRKTTAPGAFLEPASKALHYVNVMLGNGGPEPNLSGGMIPAVAPPFAMTRWTPQTRLNYVSMCPYNQTDTRLHGVIGTHQPAVWMGESGPVQLAAGVGDVVTDFEARGLPFGKADEYASANYYANLLDTGRGKLGVELSATERTGHVRFTFPPGESGYVVVDASRKSVITSDPANTTYPSGWVKVDSTRNEVVGWNDERQDHILVGDDLPATRFKGFFVARFSAPFARAGTSHLGRLTAETSSAGPVLSAWVGFGDDVRVVDVRVGVSFISVEQARRNLDLEIPDGQTLEQTSYRTRRAWADKLDGLSVTGATPHNLTVLYSGFAHTLVYPYTVTEPTPAGPAYYSGYTDAVVPGTSYSGYSIWDTFRAQTAWLLLVAPERVGEMVQSMLQDYTQGGWLPMWKNVVETNIMVGTHADAVIAQAMSAGIKDFDWDLAWEAVRKDAYVPPDRDTKLSFFDREEHTPQEVRAGLTHYLAHGFVAADTHAEAGSRTLDYAYDDHAAAIVAAHVGADDQAELRRRASNWRRLWRAETGFMEARKAGGSWAGEDEGWTEGDHWAYTLNVMHDVPGLIDVMGGSREFVDFLDRHFDEGHNLHTNEPSHHIPYLYAYAGAHEQGQDAIRKIAREEYNHTDIGLSGNEDCGQMSAWYLFGALGLYPVDPASATYVLGVPLFDTATLTLGPTDVRVRKAGAGSYVRGVVVNGRAVDGVTVSHGELVGGEIVFEMGD